MKLTEINQENITNEIIKDVLFSVPKLEYDSVDYLIVFGCHLKPLLDERIKRTIEIIQSKKVNKILLTGGVGVNGDFNESHYMKKTLIDMGVKEDSIIIEDKSTTTEENIINSIELIKEDKYLENKKILLLSSEAHLRRIGMEFKKRLDIDAIQIIYEYPIDSMISYDKVILNDDLKMIAIKEIQKIIKFINMDMIDDEKVKMIK